MKWRKVKYSGMGRWTPRHDSWWGKKRGVRATVSEVFRGFSNERIGYHFMLECGECVFNSAWPDSSLGLYATRTDAQKAAESWIDRGWPAQSSTPAPGATRDGEGPT